MVTGHATAKLLCRTCIPFFGDFYVLLIEINRKKKNISLALAATSGCGASTLLSSRGGGEPSQWYTGDGDQRMYISVHTLHTWLLGMSYSWSFAAVNVERGQCTLVWLKSHHVLP
jgi:hypothetical protein